MPEFLASDLPCNDGTVRVGSSQESVTNAVQSASPAAHTQLACYTLLRMASKDKGRKEVKKKPKPKPKAEPRKREEWISNAKPPAQS